MKELVKMWEDHWKTGVIDSSRCRYLLKEIYPKISSSEDLLKYFILAHIYNLSTSELLRSEVKLIKSIEEGEFAEKELYLIYYFKELFTAKFLELLDSFISKDLADKWNFAESADTFIPFSNEHWVELKKNLTDLKGVRAILFVRRDRQFKGRLVLIDDQGHLVGDQDSVWSIEALAKGRINKKFFLPNGDTPTGLYSIDSVMPNADQQKLFGKHRRLKIDFVNKEVIEGHFHNLVLGHQWWKNGVIASDLSRSLLRIHGTGLRNRKFYKKYHPFVTTSGCISLREDKFEEGQRVLLDKFMEYLGLETKFENEIEIYGHLCVIELDDRRSNVSVEDILQLDQ